MSTSPTIRPRRRAGPQTTKDPEVILPPYQEQLKNLVPGLHQGDTTVTLNKPSISSIGTELSGRRAEDVTWKIAQPFTLDPNTEYPYPINENEEGELEWISAAVNDEELYIVCWCFDEDNNPTIICDDNMRSLAENSRGMTIGEATAVDQNGVSLDKGCRAHTVAAYLARSKHTFSKGHLQDPYEEVAGTPLDKKYVIEYAPVRRAQPYKRIFFTIQNRGTDTKMIHSAVVKRVKYSSRFELVVRNEITDADENKQKKIPIEFNP